MYSRCCLLAQLGRRKPCYSFLLFCGVCFRTLVFSVMVKLNLKCKGIFCSRGCFGCCTKPLVIISKDEPSQVPITQSQTVNKDNREDFWSSSTLEMDHSAAQSQRSIVSTGLSVNPSDPQSSTGSQTSPPEFINHGLILWNQIRQQWIGNKKSESHNKVREPKLSTNASYDNLLGNNKPFPQPIPLGEMINFLVDIWEQDGLYD